MSLQVLQSPRGPVQAIEYVARGTAVSAFALLLPGTSIRPGPGANKSCKYHFLPEVPSIYRSVARGLAHDHNVPCLQLCWRRFPADGGTTFDAVNDMLAGITHMKAKYGQSCGVLIVGYSFGGAAIWQFLMQCAANPQATLQPIVGEHNQPHHFWLHGLVALSGALKGKDSDHVNLFWALKYLEQTQAPLLIVHGSDDDNVAISAAHKLFRRAPVHKTLCVLQGGDHNLREPLWQDSVADVLGSWLACMSLPRGQSSIRRSRTLQLAYHTAAAALCEISRTEPTVRLAFNPVPQATGSSCNLSCHTYDLDAEATARETANDTSEPRTPPDAQGKFVRSSRTSGKSSPMQAAITSHAQRQRKARDKAERIRDGPVEAAYAKLQASRDRRMLDQAQRVLVPAPSSTMSPLAANGCGYR